MARPARWGRLADPSDRETQAERIERRRQRVPTVQRMARILPEAVMLDEGGEYRTRQQQDEVPAGTDGRAIAERNERRVALCATVEPDLGAKGVGIGKAHAIAVEKRREDDDGASLRECAARPIGRRGRVAKKGRGGRPEAKGFED